MTSNTEKKPRTNVKKRCKNKGKGLRATTFAKLEDK